MKLNPFIKNKKDKDMNPKEKETAKEQELNAENLADEQLQDTENTEEAAPLTSRTSLAFRRDSIPWRSSPTTWFLWLIT